MRILCGTYNGCYDGEKTPQIQLIGWCGTNILGTHMVTHDKVNIEGRIIVKQ